jgi:hypothetical protein
MTTGRLAVTGIGVVSALGRTAERTFERLMTSDRGIVIGAPGLYAVHLTRSR